MNEPSPVTTEQIDRKWDEMSPLIDRMMERTGNEKEFPVAKGSSLAGDDGASSPYQVSHTLRQCITAGVDHLHAMKLLVRESGVIHAAAPATLARGALETFGTAFWILDPPSRDLRIERNLRWHYKNLKDGDTARSELGLATNRPLKIKLQHVQSVADQQGIGTIRGYSSTDAVTWADEHAVKASNVLFSWRLCSGFAHGRPWAYLGALNREEHDSGEEGVQNIRLEANDATTLFPALCALHLLTDVLTLYRDRASADLVP